MQFALDSAVTGYLWISLSQKAQRRPTEYDRFGGIGISMAGHQNPPASLCCQNTASTSCYCAPMIWVFAPKISWPGYSRWLARFDEAGGTPHGHVRRLGQ
jgi:hypothetical protein